MNLSLENAVTTQNNKLERENIENWIRAIILVVSIFLLVIILFLQKSFILI